METFSLNRLGSMWFQHWIDLCFRQECLESVMKLLYVGYRMTASANWLDQKLMSASAHIVIIRVVSHDDIHHFSDESPWPKPFGINERQSKEDECVSTKRITHNILFRETCFFFVPFVVVVALVVSGGDGQGGQVEPYISYAKMINAKQKHGGKMLSKLSNISSNKFVLCEFLDRRLSLSMYYLTVACVRIARLQPFFISNGQWKGMDVTNFLLFPLFIFRFSSTWLNRTTTTTTKRGIEHVLSYYTYFIYVLLMSTHRNLPLSTPFRNRH